MPMRFPNALLTAALPTFTALLVFSCNPASLFGPQAASANAKNIRASFYSGSCYGRCEVFTLELYDNGLMLYKGERFTDRPGVWSKNIDRRRMTGLLDSFARADFENYPLTFRSRIPDAPTKTFVWYDAEQVAYKTSFKEFVPPELEQLAMQVRRLAALPDWKQVSANLPAEHMLSAKHVLPVANSTREEIIVQLTEGTNAEAWVVAYGKQNVQLVKRLSPNGSYYLLSSDPNVMAARELLEFIRADAAVVGAQLNDGAQPR